MTRSPIPKALFSMRRSGARTLLMGGQACVVYGAAEFSRDLDLLIPAEGGLESVQPALDELACEPIAVPPPSPEFLARGHALHFRCRAADVEGLRVDLMAQLRGVAPFAALWQRRSTFELEGEPIDVLALPDLVLAKKTQRDKDWPMLRRLVERSYLSGEGDLEFWLRELRTPELLIELVRQAPPSAASAQRPAIMAARSGDLEATRRALQEEEAAEREADRQYWLPLKRELERLPQERVR